MRSLIWNFLAVAAVVAAAVGFEAGYMAPGDAFFLAFTVLTLYTAGHLIAREEQPLGEALASIFVRPGSQRWSVSHFSGLLVTGLGTVVVAHSLTFI